MIRARIVAPLIAGLAVGTAAFAFSAGLRAEDAIEPSPATPEQSAPAPAGQASDAATPNDADQPIETARPAEAPAAPPVAPAEAASESNGPGTFSQKATWLSPTVADARRDALAWLAARKPVGEVEQQAAALWPETETPLGGDALLNRLAATFALADPAAHELVELCRRPRSSVVLPEFTWLASDATPVFERANLRLLYGRWLAHERLYDESLAQLEGLAPADVVDPATLLFYQGVANHYMLRQEPSAQALGRLLERDGELPRRYVSLARLMLADLKELEDESLDHISRRMQDIERRLDLGRAGQKVRQVEDGVIASLDKLIDEMEKQQQAAQAAMANGAGSLRPSAPAPDSRILGGKGPGKVDSKPLGDQSGWGDLPPKQRQEALQQIGKEYPAHYRDLIEQYFRKLATEDEPAER